MSLKGTKRGAGVRGEEAGASKRRRTEPEEALWQLRPVSDLKMSSIYNRSASEAPAELFRKDLISAMMLADSEPLTAGEYWVITDTWKQDWERGVQVPVNPDSLPAPKVKVIENELPPDFQEFKLPRDKYIHLTRDAHYQSDKHVLSTMPARAEAACAYDLDAIDSAWLKLLNAERARAGAPPISEDQLEKVIEELEVRTWDKIQAIMKSEEGLNNEYDDVICDVCRSPDSEDGNEMVFCDSCNICVHQACYGITVIPDGQWLCRPCGDGVRPTCVLCPNLGGAMKCTPSGHKWAHVSCVLWIPEVSIGCAEKMEPITKISSIPGSRWSLVCVLCRERKGACIQCSVKTCKTAYHVTCAFKHGLEMRAIIEDENADDGVKLRSYCQKHSVNSKKEKEKSGSGSEEEEVKRKRRKDMTSEEKSQARAARLQEIEREFDRHVTPKDISSHLLDVDEEGLNYMYNYWKLKRRSGRNRPLLPPKSDDSELLTHRQEQADLDKMRMFVQLRQDLERVRNLCYMVSRREKLCRTFFRMREQTFHKQVAVLTEDPEITGQDLAAIIEANHGPSIYDRLYSHADAADHKNDFEELLARIAPPESGDEKKKDRNGMVKGSKSNPYKKHYVNGSRRSGSMYSGLSSEESAPEIQRPSRFRGRAAIGSSTDDDKKSGPSPKKKVSPKAKGKKSPKKTERKKKKVPQSKAVVESSSEEESIKTRMRKDSSRSRTLQQMEKEMAAGKLGQSSDSDDLIPIKTTRNNNKFPIDIYSDSSDEAETKVEIKPEKSKSGKSKEKSKASKSPAENDSQQSLPRTKGAMKEFVAQPEQRQSEKKTPVKEEEKPAPKKRGRKPSNKKTTPVKVPESDDDAKNKENIKFSKQKDPTDLIVPQRQAAKKASENMRSTTAVKKEDAAPEKPTSVEEKVKAKVPKPKEKEKEIKEPVPAKVGRKKSSKEVEKEPIAYVPQRQAAKKAAAHIKSGLGTKAAVTESDGEKKKDNDKQEPNKSSPKKEDSKSSKPAAKDSSSSSSSSSSSYTSSSSSDEEEPEKAEMKPTAKAREPKTLRPATLLSPPAAPRPTVDLPFLDKVSRPLSSTSASSDSDSSRSRCSGSSPTPRRPRRRRKRKSLSTDTSPTKALDKKLKTSERGTELGVSSSAAEGAQPSRTGDARASTRARTRSTASSGNMSHKPDARQRKPSKDDAGASAGPNKTSKEGRQPSQFSTPERKANEEIKREDIDDKTKIAKVRRPSLSVDLVENRAKLSDSLSSIMTSPLKTPLKASPLKSPIKSSPLKSSPRKSVDPKLKSPSSRRMSVKDPVKEQTLASDDGEMMPKPRRPSRYESPSSERASLSPVKKPASIDKSRLSFDKKTPPRINDDYSDPDKHWVPKSPSPSLLPPPAPVEKPGGHDKYMMEHKSLDVEMTDKSSVNMIAKIQATLNENMMIKSPKTPMDARSMDQMDIENPMVRNIRKRSMLDSEKKYITQDSSHVQGVEISKSAKIPSAVTPFPNRSGLFSPPSNDKEIFEFDMMAVDDGFNHDEIMKPFTSYPEFFFKEDSKEQGVQETLNLVDRLRSQLSSKKIAENSAQDEPIIGIDDKDQRIEDNSFNSASSDHETPTSKAASLDLHDRRHSVKDGHVAINHSPHGIPTNLSRDMLDHDEQPVAMTSNEKWPDLPSSHNDSHLDLSKDRRNYDHVSYNEDANKEPITIHSDVQSVSETGDNISLSKQSDDSQSHLSVVDHNEQDAVADNQNYDNNNSVMHSDTIASPYIAHDKWRESKIATRRSSASSSDSEESLCSQKGDCKGHMNSHSHVGVLPELEPYPALPAYPLERVEPAMPMNQYAAYAADAPYLGGLGGLGALPLFGPLRSPGPPMYAPPLPYAPSPLIPPMPKPAFPTLGAAFTSSSQNIALTTAMIAPPTPKPQDSPRDDIDVTGPPEPAPSATPATPTAPVIPEPLDEDYAHLSLQQRIPSPAKLPNDNIDVISQNSQEAKSPSKPVRTPKFPGKSPGKSPAGISPKSERTKRSSNRSNRGQRGRGRSKSRAQVYPPADYLGNSIQSKLVGTVYDFDEEIANDGGVDLKALRDKRKSVDVRDDKKSEHSYKEHSQSPTARTPPVSKRSSGDSKERSGSGASPERGGGRGAGPPGSPDRELAPVLPGPVDMRTYQGEAGPAAAPPAAAYHTHLMAFASGTADQPLADIDEEVEKQLQTALRASKEAARAASSPAPPPAPDPPPAPPPLPQVSLSDSRNQLKVKIKGPFLDANYCAASRPVVAAPPAPVAEATATFTPSAAASGSTNLRRMRKKELLRQYWTQDMNMPDDGPAVPPPAMPPPLPRAVITIPKAIASMTSIPTRDDYNDPPEKEKKKRKTTSGLSRELRHLEVSMNDVEPTDESKLSSYASAQAHKKRGRVSTKQPKNATPMPLAPKLKIKISANVVQPVAEESPSLGYQFRPPKKRLMPPAPKPSLEDLRRESMKYRKMVMADFAEHEKGKKVKPSKSEKRKKKRDKKVEKLQVVNSESDSATKLIIKIKRPKEDAAETATGAGLAAAAASAPEPPVDPFEYDPSAPDPLAIDPPSYAEASSTLRKIRTAKVTPIRLKLARSSQGSSYVMKGDGEDGAGASNASSGPVRPPPPPPPPAASATPQDSLPHPLNKHCEVR